MFRCNNDIQIILIDGLVGHADFLRAKTASSFQNLAMPVGGAGADSLRHERTRCRRHRSQPGSEQGTRFRSRRKTSRASPAVQDECAWDRHMGVLGGSQWRMDEAASDVSCQRPDPAGTQGPNTAQNEVGAGGRETGVPGWYDSLAGIQPTQGVISIGRGLDRRISRPDMLGETTGMRRAVANGGTKEGRFESCRPSRNQD